MHNLLMTPKQITMPVQKTLEIHQGSQTHIDPINFIYIKIKQFSYFCKFVKIIFYFNISNLIFNITRY
jgi:hypothetical protein